MINHSKWLSGLTERAPCRLHGAAEKAPAFFMPLFDCIQKYINLVGISLVRFNQKMAFRRLQFDQDLRRLRDGDPTLIALM